MPTREQFLSWLDTGQLPRSPAYPCPYLPGRVARQYGFAAERCDGELYHDLMDRGFRRNGTLFYAMDCPSCRACVPLRVPVAGFRHSRSQRRTWRRNQDVRVVFRTPDYDDEAYALYRRYLLHQHPGSPADEGADESAEQFRQSLYERVVDTIEVRYSVAGRLIGVSLLDVCSRSVSAVYHFFEPEQRARRIGVFSALAEIEHARTLGATWYYFGYWIAEAATMSYKAEYRPHETLVAGAWKRDTST